MKNVYCFTGPEEALRAFADALDALPEASTLQLEGLLLVGVEGPFPDGVGPPDGVVQASLDYALGYVRAGALASRRVLELLKGVEAAFRRELKRAEAEVYLLGLAERLLEEKLKDSAQTGQTSVSS